MGRHLPKREQEERDSRMIKLYRQGLSPSIIRLRFGKDVFVALKRYGLECNRKVMAKVAVNEGS